MCTLARDFETEHEGGAAAWRDDALRWWLDWYGPLWGDRAELEASITAALPAQPGESWPMVLARGRALRGAS